MEGEKSDTAHFEQTPKDLAQLAHLGNQEEHELSKFESIKRFPQSCFWCLFAVWCVLVVSFDNQAAGSILSIPEFRKDFGTYFDGNYVLDSNWQAAFQGAPVASYANPPSIVV